MRHLQHHGGHGKSVHHHGPSSGGTRTDHGATEQRCEANVGLGHTVRRLRAGAMISSHSAFQLAAKKVSESAVPGSGEVTKKPPLRAYGHLGSAQLRDVAVAPGPKRRGGVQRRGAVARARCEGRIRTQRSDVEEPAAPSGPLRYAQLRALSPLWRSSTHRLLPGSAAAVGRSGARV